jgi:hypothetical protein
LHRWRSPGLRGVRLECVRIGGIWHTTWKSFQLLCDRITELGCGTPVPPATPGLPVGGAERQDRVEQELRDRGV